MTVGDITNFLGVTNIRKVQEPVEKQEPVDIKALGKKKAIYSWESPLRVTKSMDKKMMKTVLVIAAVVSLLLIAMQEVWLVIVIASMAFMTYVLRSTPSETAKHEISNHGVSFAGHMNYWQDLHSFFFSRDGETEILAVDTVSGLPKRLFFVINLADKKKLKEILEEHLVYIEEEQKDFMEKTYNNILDKISFGE